MLKPLIRIVDDDALLRRELTLLLESVGWQVIAFDSAEAFLAAGQKPFLPGCLILDISMPLMSGLELQRVLKERAIRLPLIFLTAHADVATAVQAMKQGASDLIEKPFTSQILLDAVTHTVRGDLAHHREQATYEMLCTRIDKLSPREREVARLLIKGSSNKSIGMHLNISDRTVQVHRLHLMEKLGIHSAAELAQVMMCVESCPLSDRAST